ncbi:MAG: hypothetical protein K8963_05065 [Proteobacteria bacterium]|nr:hypothetical protein [Pseudomonadota bacterium]
MPPASHQALSSMPPSSRLSLSHHATADKLPPQPPNHQTTKPPNHQTTTPPPPSSRLSISPH